MQPSICLGLFLKLLLHLDRRISSNSNYHEKKGQNIQKMKRKSANFYVVKK